MLAFTNLTSPAMAQNQCGLRSQMVLTLAANEAAPVARALSQSGNMIEVFVTPDQRFYILGTTPQMLSCVVDQGSAWMRLKAEGDEL